MDGVLHQPFIEYLAAVDAVLAADTIINRSPAAAYALHHFNGSSQQADDYAPQTSLLASGKAQLLFPVGGRPSNGTWPYFNVSWDDQGVMVAVGWPGQWTTQLLVDEQEGLRLKAGMTSADPLLNSYGDIADAMLLDTSLEAGEEVRTPSSSSCRGAPIAGWSHRTSGGDGWSTTTCRALGGASRHP